MPRPEYTEAETRRRTWLLVGGIVLLIFLFGKVGGDEDSADPVPVAETPAAPVDAWRHRDNSTMAYLMAEDFVTQRLRAPSTADFPGVWDGRPDHVTYLGNQRYRIRSWVDAQNGFGAQIRTHWTAELEQTSENDWRLLSLEM